MHLRLSRLTPAFLVALLLVTPSQVFAQFGSGVVVDAQGVVKLQTVVDRTGALTRQRAQQAAASLSPELNRPSKLRKISLNRLEAAVAKAAATGNYIPDEMRNLAGLTEIRYVFYYPETNDIVLAGMAEGYMQDLTGRTVGLHTGRATLQLEDLVVALRAFGPRTNGTNHVGVSIDPTKDGLVRLQEVINTIGTRSVTQADTKAIVTAMKDALGDQDVTVKGISPRTHFAQVMVEADYRMKLIGIGLEKPPVNIPSYTEKSRAGSARAMQRWFFVPNYDCVKVSEDGLAMQLLGEGVQLLGQSEMVNAEGGRVQSTNSDRASKVFTMAFTKKYGELAERSPVYGQLRDLIDMLIVSAYIQEQDYYGQSGFDLGIFAHEDEFPVETYPAPATVETAVNAVWKGGTLVTPIGGGVVINAKRALTPENIQHDEEGEVSKVQQQVSLKDLTDGQWWWD